MGWDKRAKPEIDEEVPPPTPLVAGFELYRYKNAEKMRTKNWSRLYWARPLEGSDYEI